MKKRVAGGVLIGILMSSCAGFNSVQYDASKPSPEAVKAVTQKVADWQIETFDNQAEYRALASKGWNAGLEKHHEADWTSGALYTGMDLWRRIADDPDKYTDWLKSICERLEWKLYGEEVFKNIYHADAHMVGLTYLSLYEEFNDPAMLNPTKETFDFILGNPSDASLEYVTGKYRRENKDKHNYLHRWGWCDALFMAPPVWARLAKVTGDRKYLEFMDREYHATYDVLWDTKEHLFYRDTRFFTQHEQNGKPVFWSRGNGWVLGGLALMIPDLPEDPPSQGSGETSWKGRAFYIDLFKQMAESVKNCQRADGTWSMGLLGGVEGHPVKEVSGTAFFTFGLAWGVNNGLLDPAVYAPVIYKAWTAMTECVTEDGLLAYVQPIGAKPGDSFPDKTEIYGSGAFLAAGSEVYKLVGGTLPAPASVKKK